jgi:hypothetical protein
VQLNFLPNTSSQQTIISLYETSLVTLVLQLLRPLQSIRTHSLIVVVLLFFIPFIYCSTLQSVQGTSDASSESKKQNITLTALLEDQGDPARWKSLIEPAMQNLKERHPDLNIEINYMTSPYNVTRFKILSALEDKAPVDLITKFGLGNSQEKDYSQISQILPKLGAVNLIGIKQTGTAEYTKIRFMVYGRGPTYEVSGTGRTY